jgi:hypothetical protein
MYIKLLVSLFPITAQALCLVWWAANINNRLDQTQSWMHHHKDVREWISRFDERFDYINKTLVRIESRLP